MNKFKILGVAFLFRAFSYAQDIDQAKKIDAEKYQTQNHFKINNQIRSGRRSCSLPFRNTLLKGL
jgi:hypothetical protein